MRDAILTALEGVGADPKLGCPACGGMEWAVGNRTVLLSTVEPSGKLSGPRDRPGGFEVAPVWCERCGFLRLHVLQALMRD
jgi:hypothetical protein